ncbi:MAG: hypothetical protein QOF73_2755 [Thermomicrobiales bacterium]|jgi:PAS domain S-box-containing protein|nr:hypothetical protein [Thermomicrobiales bacterium]
MTTDEVATAAECTPALCPQDLGIGILFFTIRDAVIVGDAATGRIVLWSPAAETIFGYTADEAVGQPIEMLVPDELKPRHRAGLAAFAATGRGQLVETGMPVELPGRRKDGHPLTVELALSPIDTARVPGAFVLAIVRDATERKRLEAERLDMARAEAVRTEAETGHRRLAFLAEASAVLAASLDPEATLAQVARFAIPVLADWCVVHLLGDGGDLVPVAIAHDDPGKVAMAEEATHRYPPSPEAPSGPARVVRTGQTDVIGEITDAMLQAVARDDDHLRILRGAGMRAAVVVPLASRGRILGAISLVRAESGTSYGAEDVALAEELARRAATAIDNARLYAAAQEAEERFRGLFDGVADAILVADADRRYLDANPAATRLLGYTRDELLRLRVDDVVAAETSWAVTEYSQMLAEDVWRGELNVRRRDGTLVPVEARATTVALRTGPVYLATLRDVSERQELDRLQGEFLAAVSHDLKNPLTTIRAQTQLLRRRAARNTLPEPAQLVDDLDVILSSAMRLSSQLDELQDVARLRAGHPLELGYDATDLVALTREAVAAAQATSGRHGIRVEAPDAPVVGHWDALRLRRVLDNLLGNAIKYSPRGGRIFVTVRQEDRADGARAVLTVRDEGVGIPDGDMDHIFERFRRGSNVAGRFAGTGIGLSGARQIAEQHGGTIGVESEEGRGSTFTVALPLISPGTVSMP